MAILFPAPQQYFDNNGDPLAGGKVYFYEAGTTTPKNTYTDQGGATPNANPVILDSAGRASIWGTGSYKEVVKTSADVTISTKDSVTLGQDIQTASVTNAMLADMAANTVKCRAASTTGVPSDVALSANQVLGRAGSANVAGISVASRLSLVTGRYYHPSNYGTSTTAASVVANTIYAVPFILNEVKTFDRIAAYCGVQQGDTFRFGIYNDSSGVPDSLVLDCGTAVSSSNSAYIPVTISQSLNSGVYWLALNSNAGGTTSTVTAYSTSTTQYAGGFMMGVVGAPASPIIGYNASLAYGAMPSTFPTPTAVVLGNFMPWIGLRAA